MSAAVQRAHVALGERSYDVLIGSGVIDEAASYESLAAGARAVIVTNDVVGPLYAERLAAALRPGFGEVATLTLADGEASKSWATLNRVFDELMRLRCDRGTVLFALGGGVVGDITGFAAACFMRGIAFVQVPTTLLAQVDSSVGGKTGINHPAGKNMIGAFHQPRRVIADVGVLSSLPQRELVAGLAEVIKYGAAIDDEFLGWIEAHLEDLLAARPGPLAQAVLRSCQIKAEVVAGDEHETGRRAVLNFGHTFGHAIEVGHGYGQWLHGEAVGCGMVLAARLSERLGLIAPQRASRLERLVARAGLPTRPPPIDPGRLIELMRADKKSQGGRIRFVLLDGERAAKLAEAPEAVVEDVIRAAMPG